MNVKFRNKFIEIKYSVSYGLVIFITNYRWVRILEKVGIDKITDLSLKILGKSINSIPLFMKGIFSIGKHLSICKHNVAFSQEVRMGF